MLFNNFASWQIKLFLLTLSYNLIVTQLEAKISNLIDTTTTGTEYRQREPLDSSEVLKWTVDSNKSIVTFSLKSVASKKLNLALGLSKTGNVCGADLVVIKGDLGGPYKLFNTLGKNNNTIEIRSKETGWILDAVNILEGKEGSNVTVVVSKQLNNCKHDPPSICINDDLTYIIWGSVKLIAELPDVMHFIQDGHIPAYIFDPKVSLRSTGTSEDELQTWRASRKYQIPATRHTSYWCNVRKAPKLTRPHHIVGYAPYFADSLSKRHVHHQVMYRCVAPFQISPAIMFEPFLEYRGEECYLENTHQLPLQFCTEMIYAWSKGGDTFVLPKHMGIPIGETEDEYFMLESHYDNPDLLSNLVIESGVDIWYSSEIKPVEASLLLVGAGTLGLYMVPPNTSSFKMGGLCSSECTSEMLAESGGMNVYATLLHAHMATHKIRLRHFRGNTELPIIQKDDNRNFNFQQMRHLKKRVEVLPGDQLGVECVMRNKGNRTILSGFSSRDEMCMAFLLVDKRLEYPYCSSEYPTGKTLDIFGIRKVTWDRELQERIVRKADNHSEWEGRTLQSVLDNYQGQWTDEQKVTWEREQMYGEHVSVCPKDNKLLTIESYLKSFFEDSSTSLWPTTETVSTLDVTKRWSKWPKI